MPTYLYECKSCQTMFEAILKISEMDEPLKHPCQECGKDGDMMRVMQAPAIVAGVVGTSLKKDGGFKEVLQKIKQYHPHGNINV